jgi:hypothetical protein
VKNAGDPSRSTSRNLKAGRSTQTRSRMGFWRKDRKATCVYKEAHLGGADADFDGGKLVTAFDGDFVGGRNRLRGQPCRDH